MSCRPELNASNETLVLYMLFDRFLWLLNHVIYLLLTKFLYECLLSQSWVMGSRNSFSVSQQLRPELSAKWILSILSDLPFTRKTEKNVYFPIFPKHQIPNSFFWYNCKFYCLKIPITQLWKRRHSYKNFVSTWDKSRDSTAKRNLSNDM